jgi:hypothetical protein
MHGRLLAHGLILHNARLHTLALLCLLRRVALPCT